MCMRTRVPVCVCVFACVSARQHERERNEKKTWKHKFLALSPPLSFTYDLWSSYFLCFLCATSIHTSTSKKEHVRHFTHHLIRVAALGVRIKLKTPKHDSINQMWIPHWAAPCNSPISLLLALTWIFNGRNRGQERALGEALGICDVAPGLQKLTPAYPSLP